LSSSRFFINERAQNYFFDGRQRRKHRTATTLCSGFEIAPPEHLYPALPIIRVIYEKRLLDTDPHWYETNHGVRSIPAWVYSIASDDRGARSKPFSRAGQPYWTGSKHCSRREACGSLHPGRSCGDRISVVSHRPLAMRW